MKIRKFLKKENTKLSYSEICTSNLTSTVGNMFRVKRSDKGKPSITGRNHFKYVANGESMSTTKWSCSKSASAKQPYSIYSLLARSGKISMATLVESRDLRMLLEGSNFW